VLDVGCGTGIAARQFQAAGCTVLGVDVDARMALWARHRGLDVEVGTFETWDARERVFDAVGGSFPMRYTAVTLTAARV
jgi:SAM-dependent methyltransferase